MSVRQLPMSLQLCLLVAAVLLPIVAVFRSSQLPREACRCEMTWLRMHKPWIKLVFGVRRLGCGYERLCRRSKLYTSSAYEFPS